MTLIGLVQLPPFPEGRAETGPMQFGVDWPGIFIRGDDALSYAQTLERTIAALPASAWADRSMLMGLMLVLRSCSVGDTGWPP
jgi:hypothetical protein